MEVCRGGRYSSCGLGGGGVVATARSQIPTFSSFLTILFLIHLSTKKPPSTRTRTTCRHSTPTSITPGHPARQTKHTRYCKNQNGICFLQRKTSPREVSSCNPLQTASGRYAMHTRCEVHKLPPMMLVCSALHPLMSHPRVFPTPI